MTAPTLPAAKAIPDGFTAVTPYLIVADVERELAFLREAFGAELVRTSPGDDGKPVHAEAHMSGARLMLGLARGPFPPLPAMLYIYVADADAAFAKAAAVPGTTVEMPVGDQVYGDRAGTVKTADGITYCIAHRL